MFVRRTLPRILRGGVSAVFGVLVFFMKNNNRNGNRFEENEFTVADMSADWMPWNRGLAGQWRRRKSKKKQSQPKLDKKEYRAAVKGQYLAMLPMLICIVAAFGLMFLLMRLWLKG